MSAVGACNCMVVFLCRYVHMLLTFYIAELGNGSLPKCVRKDGRKKVDIHCPPMLPDSSVAQEVSRGSGNPPSNSRLISTHCLTSHLLPYSF